MKQKIIFSLENVIDLKPLYKYQLLFDNLCNIQLTQLKSTGRRPVLKEALLNALILKNLKSIPSLTELCQELNDNPSAALRCNFDIRKPIPSVERFSSFPRDTPHQYLSNIRNFLVQQLIDLDIITGDFISIDSCPIPVNVKENNL